MEIPTYLVLSATGGIGRVLCERLAKRGASLVLGGRDPEKLNALAAQTLGKVSAGDASDAGAVEGAVARAVERFGRLDGAVNPVGSILLKPAHLTSTEEWEEVIVSGQVIGVDGGLAALRGRARA
jgi:NAD(P)-dependent dehydrogenase (short-subunit alcohol dehydrogenase family)